MKGFYDFIASLIRPELVSKFEPLKYLKMYFENFADFNGKSKRAEFWWPALFNIIVSLVISGLSVLFARIGFLVTLVGIISLIWALINLVPGISATIRRLHDVNKSGWFILFVLIPIIGAIALLIILAQDSVKDSKY